MTQKQENNLSRHLAVEKFCDDNNSIWTLHVQFAGAKTAYSAKIATINGIVALQEKDITGVSLDKSDLKIQLIATDLIIAGALVSLAVDSSNNTLEKSMTFTDSKLTRLSDTELNNTSLLIHDTANANLIPLGPYGITAAVLTTQDTIRSTYNLAVPSTRNAVTTKSVLTFNLAKILRETDTVLKKKILTLGLQFKAANPDFYKGIIENAIIIDLGKTTTTFRFTIKDADGNPLKNVNVKIGALSSLSNEFGKGSIKKVPFGEQDITITKPLFQSITLTAVKFLKGKSVTKTITLLPV